MKNKIMLLALLVSSNFLVGSDAGSDAGAGAGTVDSSDYTAVLSDSCKAGLEAVTIKTEFIVIDRQDLFRMIRGTLQFCEQSDLIETVEFRDYFLILKNGYTCKACKFRATSVEIKDCIKINALEKELSELKSRGIALERDAADKFSRKAVVGISLVAAISGGLAVHLLSKPGVQEKISKLINRT